MFFKIALRIFSKFLPTKIASIFILSVGILFFTVASTIYVKSVQFNNKLPNADRIFRVNTRLMFQSGSSQELSVSPALAGPHLKSNLSEVENQTRIQRLPSNKIKVGNNELFGEDVVAVDPSFFDIFVFSEVLGSINDIKRGRPDVAVLSLNASSRLFGQDSPIGKLIVVNDKDYVVSSVILESESDFDHAIFIPIQDDIYAFEWIETFLLLKEPAPDLNVQSSINSSLEEPMAGEYNNDVMQISFHPIGLSELRFQDALFSSAKTNKIFLFFLMSIAVILMSLCCLSVLNFEGTISLNRVKEVAIRKSFGASDFQIFYQFIIENSFVFLVSLPLVITSFYLLIPSLNSIWNYKLTLSDLIRPHTILLIFIFLGIYLVLMTIINYKLYLTNGILQKGNRQRKPSFNNGITKFLLPFQLFICVFVLCFTSLSTRQLRQMNGAKVGFTYDNVYVADITGVETTDIAKHLKERLSSESGILRIAQVSRQSVPGRDSDIQLFNLNNSEAGREIAIQQLFVDDDYFKLLGINVLNEKKIFRDGDIAINSNFRRGHFIRMEESNLLNGRVITNEVSDYYHDGLYAKSKPMVFQFDETKFDALLIKVLPGTNKVAVEQVINQFIDSENLGVQVSLTSLKEVYFSKQKDDYQLLEIIILCNYFMMVITILGIVSSTNMIYNLLKKQNVIRKIHGASDLQLLAHSSKLVFIESLIAFVVAVSIAHLSFFEWQKRYAIKIPPWLSTYIPLGIFILVSLCAFIFFFLMRLRKIKYADMI